MVNEINKPPSSDNLRLSERLSASNRQLQEMQEEHRQLIQEMEMLRHRAAELSRLNAHFGDTNDDDVATASATNTPVTDVDEANKGQIRANESSMTMSTADGNLPKDTLPNTTTKNDITSESEPGHDNTDGFVEDEDPEAAQYLQEKLAELASLRTQFKRVQNMVNSTDLIEKHLNAHRNNDAEDNLNKIKNIQGPSHDSSNSPTAQEVNLEGQNLSSITSQSPSSGVSAENEELMSAMMNMFTEFTSDLRSQAEDLRAERDRIRTLKEELLRRKNQS